MSHVSSAAVGYLGTRRTVWRSLNNTGGSDGKGNGTSRSPIASLPEEAQANQTGPRSYQRVFAHEIGGKGVPG